MKAMPGRMIDLLNMAGIEELAVSEETTVRSYCITLPSGNPSISVEWQLSSTAPNVKIELEHSNQESSEAEGVAEDNFVVPDSDGLVSEACTDETVHFMPIKPCFSGLARFKITGLTGNHADTVFTRLRLRITK